MKIFKAYVLIEAGEDQNHRHVSVKVEGPIGAPVIEEIDLEMNTNDIASIKKITKQFNESRFGKKVEILVKGN